jgi:5-(carboxyamino)imidazole ribonucleotide synthase
MNSSHSMKHTDKSPLSVLGGNYSTPRIGIIGGGQLAKMTAQAAFQLGCDVVVLERQENFPAHSLDTDFVLGDWDDPACLLPLAAKVDVLTLENEFVDAGALAVLEAEGHKLIPGSQCIRVVQDKLWQKQALHNAGLPVPRFVDTPNPQAVLAAAEKLGWPILLKKRRNGYDGKGNATVKSEKDIEAAWRMLGGQVNLLYVEEFCSFDRELAVMITRGQDGTEVAYPVVDTVQRDHVCHLVMAPAKVSSDVAACAAEIAKRAVAAIGGVGTMGVELFLASTGEILINEMAPRVHNSGHYTIEACVCSQFENHVRAVLGWPLGSTAMRAPAAAMINLLGVADGNGEPLNLSEALRVEGAHVHIYGKTRSSRGRKMGHLTALGNTIEKAVESAQLAAGRIRFGAVE